LDQNLYFEKAVDQHHDLITGYFSRNAKLQKISPKLVHNFLSNVSNKWTDTVIA